MKKSKMKDSYPYPSPIDYIKISTNSELESASSPWSNSSPKGDEEFVLLACLPSTASNV